MADTPTLRERFEHIDSLVKNNKIGDRLAEQMKNDAVRAHATLPPPLTERKNDADN
jgi:hypothetical protein